MRGLWGGASFSLKFATVILVAGATIAAVPLLLAEANTRNQVSDSAADKVGIATNLIAGQRISLEAFTAGVARQLAAAGDLASAGATQAALEEDAEVIGTDDVLGVMQSGGSIVMVQGSTSLDPAASLGTTLVGAVQSGSSTAATAAAGVWLVATAPITGTAATAFVARPVTAAFISAIDHNLATTSHPVDIVLVRADGRYALTGRLSGSAVTAGGAVNATLADAIEGSSAAVVTLNGQQVAVAPAPLGAGYTLVVVTPVTGPPFGVQSILLLLAVILVAMVFIVVVVQIDLRRPLHRLDRAVAALGSGDFDVPVRADTVDEVGRLGASFELMRVQVRSTMRATAARAAVATELTQAQPLETALTRVCTELRRSMEVDLAAILVGGSEMSDPFAVADDGRHIAIGGFLDGNGPLGEGYRHDHGALLVGATDSSAEARLGVREFCVAPLRVGTHVHGVLAVAAKSIAFTTSDTELVASTAEQVSLALERYRFLAVVQRQASVDDLTGLYNHRFLVDSLGQQVALAERLGTPLALLMLDIDHFKVLNDTHGHHAGDVALASFAHTLLSTVRRADLAARYGGEEFVVVMPDTSAQEAFMVAEKIRLAVAARDVRLSGRPPVRLTVSIGVAAFPEDTRSAGELITLADQALYRAKRSGRDRTCMAEPSRAEPAAHTAPPIVQDAQMIEGEANVGAGRGRSQE